jgi:hypothetical protein
VRQHAAVLGGGLRREGEVRSPRPAPRRRTDGVRTVGPVPSSRPGPSRLAQPGPLHPLRGPRLGASLRPAPRHRLRPHAGGPAAVPAVGQPHPGPPRTWAYPRGRGYHRASRSGIRHGRRHGHRGAPPSLRVQPEGAPGRRPLHLRDRIGRGPDGRDLLRGRLPGGHARAGEVDLPLRRQPRFAGRPDRVGVHRERPPAVRGLRLAGASSTGRERPGRDRSGDPRGPSRDRPPVDHLCPHPSGVRKPGPGHPGSPRGAARPGEPQGDQGEARLAARARVLHSRSGARPPARRSRPGNPLADGVGNDAGGVPVHPPDGSGPMGRTVVRPPPRRLGFEPSRVPPHRWPDGDARRLPEIPFQRRSQGSRVARGRGRPLAVDQDPSPRLPRLLCDRRGRTELPFRRPGTRDGGDHERDGVARRADPLRRHVPHVLRLCPRRAPVGRAPADPHGVRVHARQYRNGRGRTYPPAGRAAPLPARHPEHDGDPPGGRQRDHGGLAGSPDPVGPDLPRVQPPEAPDTRSRGVSGCGRGSARGLRARRGL